MAAKRKPPRRRNPVAKALRSPALRQRVVPNKKRKVTAFNPVNLMAYNWCGIDRF